MLDGVVLIKGMSRENVNTITIGVVELVDCEYKGSKEKHHWKCCKCGTVTYTRLDKIKRRIDGCLECINSKLETTYMDKVNALEGYEYIKTFKAGETLPSNELVKSTRMQIKHKCGHIFYIKPNQKIKCKHCIPKKKNNDKVVKESRKDRWISKFGEEFEVIEIEGDYITAKHKICKDNNVMRLHIDSWLDRKYIYCDNCKNKHRKYKIANSRIIDYYKQNFVINEINKKQFNSGRKESVYELECNECYAKTIKTYSSLRHTIVNEKYYKCEACGEGVKLNESKLANYVKYILRSYLQEDVEFEKVTYIAINGEQKRLRPDIIIPRIKIHIEINGKQHYETRGLFSTNQEYYKAKVDFYKKCGYTLIEIDTDQKLKEEIAEADKIIVSILKKMNINYSDFEIIKHIALNNLHSMESLELIDNMDYIKYLYNVKLKSIREIAKEIGCCTKTLSNFMKAHMNIEITSKRDRIENEVCICIKNGMRDGEILEVFGISNIFLNKIKIDNDLQTREDKRVVVICEDGILEFKCQYEAKRGGFMPKHKHGLHLEDNILYSEKMDSYFCRYDYYENMNQEDIENLYFKYKLRDIATDLLGKGLTLVDISQKMGVSINRLRNILNYTKTNGVRCKIA